MENIKNDYCIRLFTSKGDDLRPYMNNVNLNNNFLYASDAHILAKIRESDCVHKYNSDPKYPDADKLFQMHEKGESKKIEVEHIFNDLMKIECCFKPRKISCNDCDGDGDFTCKCCDSVCECKKCKGDGVVDSNELELSGEFECTILNKKYKLHYLDNIIRTAVYTGVKEIEVINDKEDYNGTIFIVGSFEILLMPCR